MKMELSVAYVSIVMDYKYNGGISIMRIKRLSLERWMRDPKGRMTCDKSYTEISPIFYKEGYYSVGGSVWFEVEGRAFLMKKFDIMFNYSLKALDAWDRLDYKKVKALESIVAQNLATKSQRELLSAWRNYYFTRAVYRNAVVFRKRLIGR